MNTHRSGEVRRTGQILPDDFAERIQTLRFYGAKDVLNATLAEAHRLGWTLEALAAPLGVTRERVRQLAAQPSSAHPVRIPEPPRWPERQDRPTMPADVVAELRSMRQVAAKVNGGTPAAAPERVVSERLTARMVALLEDGWTYQEIADAAGVSKQAVVFRLRRYGYKIQPPSQKPYKGHARGEATARPRSVDRRPNLPSGRRPVNAQPAPDKVRAWSAPRMPKLRDRTAALLGDPDSFVHQSLIGAVPGADKIPSAPGPYGNDGGTCGESEGVRRLATHLLAADLYWVTPQMATLAVGAAGSLNETRWSTADRPCDYGLVIWDGGISTQTFGGVPIPVVAAMWAPHRDGLAVELFMSRYDMASKVRARGVEPPLEDIAPLVPTWGQTLPVSADWQPVEELGSWRTSLTTLWATWSLMQTPTIVEHPHPRAEIDRDIRRSYGRAGKAVAEVSVVDLRRVYRPAPERDEEGGEPGRETSYRFAVAAHWQDYWTGPGRAVKVKKLAAPYIGGTPGKPLRLDMEKVYVWRR